MIILIIFCFLIFALSAFLFWYNDNNSKNYRSMLPVMTFFFEFILIIVIFILGFTCVKLSKKAEGKCPDLVPVKEQLYKMK